MLCANYRLHLLTSNYFVVPVVYEVCILANPYRQLIQRYQARLIVALIYSDAWLEYQNNHYYEPTFSRLYHIQYRYLSSRQI